MATKLTTCRTCGVACESGYCDKHPKRSRRHKLKTAERGYDWKWQQFSRRYRRANPWCVDCLTKERYAQATEVHHIKKVIDFPELRFDLDNLMALCGRCHDKRTARGE